jgi:hypothetical protein
LVSASENKEEDMLILKYMFVISGLLLAGLSIPMILRKIPPNGLYGFRVRKTMENPDIWYRVNSYSGKWLLATGLVIAATAFGIAFIPGISLDMYAYAVLAVWVVVFTILIVTSVRYMNSL